MGRAYTKHGEERKCISSSWGNLKGRGNFGDLYLYQRMILK